MIAKRFHACKKGMADNAGGVEEFIVVEFSIKSGCKGSGFFRKPLRPCFLVGRTMGVHNLPDVAAFFKNERRGEIFAPLLAVDHIVLPQDEERRCPLSIRFCGEALDREIKVRYMTVSRPKTALRRIQDPGELCERGKISRLTPILALQF